MVLLSNFSPLMRLEIMTLKSIYRFCVIRLILVKKLLDSINNLINKLPTEIYQYVQDYIDVTCKERHPHICVGQEQKDQMGYG